MPAPAKYPPPPEQVRARLELARSRQAPFERAWPNALRSLHVTGGWVVAKEWREALEATVDEWRAAYVGEPPIIPAMAALASERLGVAAPA